MQAKRVPAATAAALVVLALSAWLTQAKLFKQTVQGNTNLTRQIPAQLGAWTAVEESPASANEIRGLETSDIIKRTYVKGGYTIQLVVAYIAQSSRKSAHAQEACLRGAGAMVGSVEMVQLRDSPVQAKALSLDLHDHREWVYYWYKMGSHHTAEYLMSSLKMFLGGLGGGKPQGTTLIRLLTHEVRGEKREEISQRIEDFTVFLVPALEKALP
jgi:EpsI family protein